MDTAENLYVDIDEEDNIKEKMEYCNQQIQNTRYSIKIKQEDTYCIGAYFLSVVQM